MPNVEQERLIARYAEGPDRLEAALNLVPGEALKWSPGPGKWSVHQVVVHCADSETNSAMRVRYLLGEESPTIIGYDQDRWVDAMDYDAHPLIPALATIRAVRANTVPLLRRLTPAQWARQRNAYRVRRLRRGRVAGDLRRAPAPARTADPAESRGLEDSAAT